MTEKLRSVAVVGALALSTVWTLEQVPEVTEPLTYQPQTVDGRQMLAVDEETGRVVEAFGDLSGADSVVVFVPGAGWNREKFDDPDEPMSPRDAARTLTELTEQDDSAQPSRGAENDVASIAWLGYRPPSGLGVSALRSERAESGARELTGLVRWLPDDVSVTLVCHSYGGVVCGKAAPDVSVDNIVSVGGAGMDVDRVGELDTSANVWVSRAEEDMIKFLPDFRFGGFGHGRSEISQEFGGFRLDTGDAREHSDYYEPGDATMTNLVRIAEGDYAEVSHA